MSKCVEIFVVIDNKRESYEVVEMDENSLKARISHLNDNGSDYELVENVPEKLAKILLEKQKKDREEKHQTRLDIRDYFRACEKALGNLEQIYNENYQKY